ncbi:hypothetical protein DJ73_02175 [Halorubrum sp. Ea1]|uniref:hypothetical protein n=1 Tax=Halorubrum sp. Ea1 TaxID=1480718 RepID=UPI000B98ACE2|nr:hypothetical protein [Halorubrum sp. Ea1]OYR55528.1 hypothetical protein DJ73_02175 [Halorubrum sp. Ea1]
MPVATIALAVVAIGAIVYVAGVERTQAAAAKAGSGAKRATQSTAAAGIAGAGLGLQFGDQLLNAILAEPGFAFAAVAGIFGGLGTGGFLGGISALQFLLVGVIAFLVIYGVFGGGDD